MLLTHADANHHADIATINQLFVYPIKSCAGVSVSCMEFDQRGPLLDRRWMLVDAETHVFLTQREFARMCLISTAIIDGEVWASQSCEQQLPARVKLPFIDSTQGQVNVQVWEDSVQGFDCGDELAGWFSELLSHPCRLIYQGACERTADETFADPNTSISYADGFPLLVVAQSSIDFINKQCQHSSVSAVNFRPNVVIKNTAAFAENNWQALATSTLTMKVVKPCQRCVIPTINPETAQQQKDILAALVKFCRRDQKIFFGQNLTFNVLENNAHGVLNNAEETARMVLEIGQGVAITLAGEGEL